MYKDMVEKLKEHRQRIIQGFINIGVYPDDKQVKDLLDGIDLGMPYLYVEEAIKGKAFDSDAYNAMFVSIYKDLALLYHILHELSVKELTMLNAYIDTHVDELERTVNYYKTKSIQEANTTSLGETILFKNSGFNTKTHNNLTLIDLGDVALHSGSRVACLIDADEIEAERVVFSFYKDDEFLKTTAYNYNYSSLKVPGEINKKEYDYNIAEDQKISGAIKIDIGIEPSYNNKYTILGGKDKVLVKQFGETNGQYIKDRPTKFDMLGFNEKTYIDFYTIGTKSVTFRFNKKPISTNFPLDSYQVTNLKHVHHFFIECDEGFSFDFDIDGGEVFALKEEGVITDQGLYLPKPIDIRDFHVIEYQLGDTEKYNVIVEVINDDGEPLEINSIAIKELLAMEGDSNDIV